MLWSVGESLAKEIKFMVQNDSLSAKVGKNLKRIIKEHGLTQDKFAELMYVDPTTVRRWIANGIDKISIIEEIARFFDMDVYGILFD